MMEMRFVVLLALAAAAFSGANSTLAASGGSAAIRMFNKDKDATLDMPEIGRAASALFGKLDRDHDGTLDRGELAGRLTRRQFRAADPDHDGTLTRKEYLAAVQRRFGAANPDKDGTLDARELNTSAGRALLKLLR
jgi:Ca2+-binding EF-hand superfamily protein